MGCLCQMCDLRLEGRVERHGAIAAAQGRRLDRIERPLGYAAQLRRPYN
jgi:hypothetical protein